MDSKLKITDHMQVNVIRQRGLITQEELYGGFKFEQYRGGELIGIYSFANGATNEGKQYLLGAGFNGVSPINTWVLGIIDGTGGTPVLSAPDTMLSHAGWDEFVLYDETLRQPWTKTINTLTNQAVSSAAAQFTISSTVSGTMYIAGGFLASNNTKSGTSGVLWATGLFGSPVPIQGGDVFKMNYVAGL